MKNLSSVYNDKDVVTKEYVDNGKQKASTTSYGITKLSTSVSSGAIDMAATPSAVKLAYDKANDLSITVNDIDAICNASIQALNMDTTEVTF